MKFTKLKNWIKEKFPNADFSKIQLNFYEGNRKGIKATTDIKLGEKVLKIPYNKMITNLNFEKYDFYEKMLEHGLVEKGKPGSLR